MSSPAISNVLATGNLQQEASRITPSQRGFSPPLWASRTPEINASITQAFKQIAKDSVSTWRDNGRSNYYLCEIKEHELMEKLIQASPERKDFFALDIGAGDFQWGRGLAQYLNEKKDLPEDVTIHIIGIRGEKNELRIRQGRCLISEFGFFPIERLAGDKDWPGLSALVNKVDLIVSRWTLRHCVDPVGTFVQAYDLLRPQTGHMLFDGFYFLDESETVGDRMNDNDKMARLCLETGAPFLTQRYDQKHSLDHFILRRPDESPCRLQKQYAGIERLDVDMQIESRVVTRFKPLETDSRERAPLLTEGDYRGDKDLYDWLKQNQLLFREELVWGPLQETDGV